VAIAQDQMNIHANDAIANLAQATSGSTFRTILADPPWRFINRTGKIAPEHLRLSRYKTLSTDEICALPINAMTQETAHLYLRVPNALLPDGLRVLNAWGFQYKTNIVWHKIRKDGGSDDRLIEDRAIRQQEASTSQYLSMLDRSRFHFISGRRSVEKDLATKHLLRLYEACGGRTRFSEEEVKARQKILLPDLHWFANSDEPVGAIHPTNHRIIKIIPRACAMLALYCAGFISLNLDELDSMDVDEFIRTRTKEALEKLHEAGISPTMSAEDLMRLTRGR
jgi:MT-A70 protein